MASSLRLDRSCKLSLPRDQPTAVGRYADYRLGQASIQINFDHTFGSDKLPDARLLRIVRGEPA
jgi:hypothetical protein